MGQIESGGIPDEAKHTEDVRRVHEAYQFLAQKYLGRLKRKEEDQGPNSISKILPRVWASFAFIFACPT